MSKSQTLRALVNERLTAAAEEIFALFEKTIAEYGEELCRSVKQESQTKRRLLDEVNPRVLLPRAGEGVQVSPLSPSLNQEITQTEEEQLPGSVSESSAVCGKTEELSLLQQIQTERREEEAREENISSVGAGVQIFSQIPPGSGLNQKITQTVGIKEEQSVKLEEEQLLISAPKSSAVCAKSEELQQRQTEHREETEGDTELSSNTDNDDEWEPAFSCPDAQMGAEADGDHYNQVQNRITAGSSGLSLEYRSAPETSVNDDEGAQRRGHQCFMCGQTFKSNQSLEIHLRVHTGERPYSCPTCEKTFVRKSHLHIHMRTHTGDKPYSCSFCNKEFTVRANLKVHMRVHTGEKPYRCSMCAKTFVRKAHLNAHMRTHTGDRPYSCSICNKSFSQKSNLNAHARIHTAEKPYSCPVCNKEFIQSSNLKAHMRTHAK